MDVVLAPLRFLRHLEVGTYCIRDASFEEANASHTSWDHVGIITSQLPSDTLLNELIQSGTSNGLVDFPSEMYPRVLSYAQSFERYIPFKLAMDLPRHEVDISPAPPKQCYRPYVRRTLQSPFRDTSLTFFENSHPVEAALNSAKEACEVEDVDRFKFCRARILEYLEPQYQRIMTASSNLVDFIKRNKRPGDLFDAESIKCSCNRVSWRSSSAATCDWDLHIMAEASVLLDQYAKSFRRDMPLRIQIEIRKQKKQIDGLYFQRDREGALIDLNRDIELCSCDEFVSLFKCAFEHMEKQRQEIREARKGLFTFDCANDRQTDIDLESLRCDDFVDFSVNEPLYCPLALPSLIEW